MTQDLLIRLTEGLVIMGAPAVTGHGILSLLNQKQRLVVDVETLSISYAVGIVAFAALSYFIGISGLNHAYTGLLRASVMVVSLSSLAFILYRSRLNRQVEVCESPPPNSPSRRVLNYIITAAIVTQALVLLQDNYSQSIWAWDSVKFWINRSAAWFGTDSIGFWSWTGNDYELKYYSDQYIDREPPLVSLTFLWAISLAGSHTSDLVSLPSVVALYAICGLVYSQTLQVTRSITAALLASLMTSTIPLLTTHAVSAGYADIWLTLFITTFITVAYSSARPIKGNRVLLLFVLFISIALTKDKGIWYAGYCCAAVIIFRVRPESRPSNTWIYIRGAIRAGYFFLLVMAIIGSFIHTGFIPPDLDQTQWVKIVPAIDYVTTIFLSDSWGFLLATLVLLVTLYGTIRLPNIVLFSEAFVLFLLAGIAALATIPLFTSIFYDGTTFDRASLILVPQATVIVTYYFHTVLTQACIPVTKEHGS